MQKPRKPAESVREYLAAIGRKGGKARLTKLTAKQRKDSARRAALARWNKRHRG